MGRMTMNPDSLRCRKGHTPTTNIVFFFLCLSPFQPLINVLRGAISRLPANDVEELRWLFFHVAFPKLLQIRQ